jgi:hypothetical protein
VLLPPPLGPIMAKKSLILMERFISFKTAAHGMLQIHLQFQQHFPSYFHHRLNLNLNFIVSIFSGVKKI